MNLEKQVCSLDLARKLKELGVKQESLFAYATYNDDDVPIVELIRLPGTYSATFHSAFTVAELGEMLPGLLECSSPKFVSEGKRQWELFCGKDESPFVAYFNAGLGPMGNHGFIEYADTEADARAAMMCYLLEQKLIVP